MAAKELLEYIMEQLSGLEEIRSIPMMGGYIFYYRERIFGGIYGNGFMVKDTKAGRKYMPDSEPEPPYKGAKDMLPVTILEDRGKLRDMVAEMYEELPERKAKRSGTKTGKEAGKGKTGETRKEENAGAPGTGEKKTGSARKGEKEKAEGRRTAFDYKKEYKEFYMPKNRPEIVTVPPANYVAVRGSGDPNEPDGEYKKAVAILYAVAYTIKMSKMGSHRMDGYFDFVVPPLEGFWRQEGKEGFDYSDKSLFRWISVIRLPEFVTEEEFAWARREAQMKKKLDCSKAEFYRLEEGLCVQMMHIGSFDNEPASVEKMDLFLEEKGYRNDFSQQRLHHEIYLSDARKVPPERWKTVIRHPIAKAVQ